MAPLKNSKTHENLKAAFAGESQANRRYLYFAKQADVEGRPDIAGLFRDTAEGETGHAHGHLDFLKQVGDPATDLPIGDTALNLRAAVAGDLRVPLDVGDLGEIEIAAVRLRLAGERGLEVGLGSGPFQLRHDLFSFGLWRWG